ncbi:hypothetical protein ABTX15_32500 [Micromonospora sp. NPDC094482]|uniref:hypothetical protein n=1 Tax=unclassified Micromonospora TaxID=2617518 RepID=UPI0033184572
MVSGDDTAAAIEFYVPQVSRFVRNGRVLGFSYGHRLRGGRSGHDQLVGVVQRLRHQPGTRQANGVVWEPADAVREPLDIPCTIARPDRQYTNCLGNRVVIWET